LLSPCRLPSDDVPALDALSSLYGHLCEMTIQGIASETHMGQEHSIAVCLRAGADCPCGTRLAVFQRKLDVDEVTARRRTVVPPGRGPLALRAAHVLLVPVHRTLLERVRPLDLRLPALAGPCGAPQVRPCASRLWTRRSALIEAASTRCSCGGTPL